MGLQDSRTQIYRSVGTAFDADQFVMVNGAQYGANQLELVVVGHRLIAHVADIQTNLEVPGILADESAEVEV